MAGFRSGRGRDHRDAQQQAQFPQAAPPPPPGQPPYPQAYGGQPGPGWQPGAPPPPPPGSPGEPEYFGGPPQGPRPGAPDPRANHPGHTQAFSFGEAPDAGQPPYDDDYGGGHTYAAGQPTAPVGPRLHWKQLLQGIVLRPNATFWQMRDYTVWGPAITVTFLYGLLAVFGFDQAREDVLNSTLSSGIPYVLTTGIAVVLAGLMLGAVTHTLARQLGGDGAWGPTIGLSMLIMSITDAPRLLFAMFMGGTAGFVQLLGWATWVAAGVLFTLMISRSHDLPWMRALGASSIQLVALLVLIKLGTL